MTIQDIPDQIQVNDLFENVFLQKKNPATIRCKDTDRLPIVQPPSLQPALSIAALLQVVQVVVVGWVPVTFKEEHGMELMDEEYIFSHFGIQSDQASRRQKVCFLKPSNKNVIQ